MAAPVAAQENPVPRDTFQPYVGAMVTYDDNLLRRDTSLEPNAQYSDTYKTTFAGLSVEWPLGRQLLTADLQASKVSFNRFTDLDYSGKDATTDLAWRVGNQFSGNVGAKYVESLASFADFQAAERNVRTVKTVYANGKWRFHPSWRVATGYREEKYHFDLPSQRANNRSESSVDAGVDYIAKSGNFVGLMLRTRDGDYDVQAVGVNNVRFDNGYRQDEVNLNVNWIATGVTQITFLGGWARREHNSNSVRNVSGGRGRLIANWSPRSAVMLSASVWRDFSASEGVFVNSAVSTGASVDAKWAVTSKIAVNGRVSSEKRDFRPLPGVAVIGDLSDSTRQSSLGVTYEPLRLLSLNLNAFHASRSGSTAAFTNSYRAKGVGFSATVKF